MPRNDASEPRDDLVVMTPGGGIVYQSDLEEAKKYSQGRMGGAGDTISFQLTFEIGRNEIEELGDGFIFDSVVRNRDEFQNAKGSRSSDALNAAVGLIFSAQLMNQIVQLKRKFHD